jgi:ABC-type antimicrobial peptide transport system permease subunit
VGFLSFSLEKLAQGAVNALPWNTVFIVLFCFLLIAFYIYWLAARRREKEGKDTANTDHNGH